MQVERDASPKLGPEHRAGSGEWRLVALIACALAVAVSSALLVGLERYLDGTRYTIVPADPRLPSAFRLDRRTGELWLVGSGTKPERLLPDPVEQAIDQALSVSTGSER